jgi:predicted HTH transcriptional regulator
MITHEQMIETLKELQALPRECEWVEFKVNNAHVQEIGEYLSALGNSACYHNKEYAYLVFGVEDETHRLVGTTFSPHQTKIGNQELENWLATQLNPRIDFNIFEFDFDEKHFSIFRISATRNTPVSFRGEYYIRIGSYKKRLDDHPERERKIWHVEKQYVFDKQDKIRSCYLHACLKYVSGEYMTNQSLRERFNVEEHNYAIVSRIIADTIKAELIKDYNMDSKSKKFAKYVPYWF